MRKAIVLMLCSLSPFVAGFAGAEEIRFGAHGQLVLSDDQPIAAVDATSPLTPAPASATKTASAELATVSDNGGTGTAFVLAPAADYFVARSLSLGGNVLIGVLNPANGAGATSPSLTLFGFAPRVGYDVAFSSTISLWPKLYFGYVTVSGGGTTATATSIGAFAPLLFHLVPHFFFGIGPNASTQLTNQTSQGGMTASVPKVTVVGVQATLGGWLLGD